MLYQADNVDEDFLLISLAKMTISFLVGVSLWLLHTPY